MNATRKDTSKDEVSALADQETVAAFLSDPLTHGAGVTSVERIDTHASQIFLAGDRAYKVKRAIHYPYLDYGTLERRRRCCVKEVALNRRTAAELYLGVTAITLGADSRLHLGGEGEAVEWAIVMRRFDQDHLFDAMGRAGHLTPALMTALADEIADFHRRAERVHGAEAEADLPEIDTSAEPMDFGGASGISRALEETLEELADHPGLFPSDQRSRLAKAARSELARVGPLLDARRVKGFVRHCHGDLHLRNICLLEGRPRLFDGIEFNDDLTCIDTLYDLAFLLMDLEHRGQRPLANLVLNRYLRASPRFSGLTTLPLFLAVRALVRAKVNASAADLEEEGSEAAILRSASLCAEAVTYFREAVRFLTPTAPCLVAIGGLSGSGKSSLARALAPRLGASPGALILRSDVVRKSLFGVEDEVRLPKGAYRPEVSKRVYGELRHGARAALAAGHSVIIDALQNHPSDRQAIEDVAVEAGLNARSAGAERPAFHGFWLDAPPDTLMARIAKRCQAPKADASDANAEVLARQLAQDLGPLTWTRLDATRDVTVLAAEAEAQIRG